MSLDIIYVNNIVFNIINIKYGWKCKNQSVVRRTIKNYTKKHVVPMLHAWNFTCLQDFS